MRITRRTYPQRTHYAPTVAYISHTRISADYTALTR